MEILFCSELWDSSTDKLRISIYFNRSLVWNTTAGEREGNSTPLLPTLYFFLKKLRKEAVIWRAGVEILSGATTFQELLALLMEAHLKLNSNVKFVIACFRLWPACYFLSLDAELCGLQHHFTLRNFSIGVQEGYKRKCGWINLPSVYLFLSST